MFCPQMVANLIKSMIFNEVCRTEHAHTVHMQLNLCLVFGNGSCEPACMQPTKVSVKLDKYNGGEFKKMELDSCFF